MPPVDPRAYTVRAYRPGDEAAILTLFNAVWSPAGLPARDLSEWRWQFADAPLGHWTMVACSEDDRVIATYVGMPLPCEVNGEPVVSTLCVDSMVHPEWRHGLQREGPFLAVARAFYAQFDAVPGVYCNYGFPNRAAKRIGERLLRYLPLHDPMPVVYHNLFDAGSGNLRHDAAPGVEVVEVTRFGDDADALWQRARIDYPFAVRRDRAYLNWRYADCPKRFLCWEVRAGGELRGIAVARERWVGQPILALADYVARGDDRACLAAVLQRLVDHAQATEHGRVEAWLPRWSRVFAAALDMGWRTQLSGILSVMRLPGHWDEYEWHRDHFFVTIGDSDIY